MNFWRASEILGKRRWLILFSVLVAAVLTGGATRLVGSKWVGTVRLVVPQNAAMVRTSSATSSTEDASGEGMAGQEALKSQIAVYTAVVKSRSVIEPVFAKLGVTELPNDFLRHIEITASGPRLYELSVTDSTPLRAKALANAIAEQFVEKYRSLSSDQSEKGAAILKEQMQATNVKLANLRARYDKYRGDHQIAGTLNNNLELALTRLKDNRQKADETTQRLAEAEAQLRTMEGQPLPKGKIPAPPAVNIAAVQLAKELDAAEKHVTELRSRYTESWPEVKKAVEKRDDIKSRLEIAASTPTGTTAAPENTMLSPETVHLLRKNEIEQNIAGYAAKLNALNGSITAAQAQADLLKGVDGAMNTLTNDITEQTDIRNALAGRLSRAQMQLDVSHAQNPIEIMDSVNDFNPPLNITQGRTLKLTVIGALCALLLSSAIVLALDSVDRRLKTVTEAEFILPVKMVAAIPQPMGKVTYELMARATELQPQSLHAEAFRFLGMHVLNQKTPMRSIMVLSAKAEQGSTTSLVNLGISLAQAGKRVILVDANIRTPELHQAFTLENTFGFTDLMASPTERAIDKALHRTSVANLQVVTSGATPANAWEMFRSPNLLELSDRLHEQADYVLYDTPSALMFTDALNMAAVVDGAFLCVRAFQPLTGSEERILDLLKEANVTMMGGIMTDVPASVIRGFDNYQHYYAAGIDQSISMADGQTITLEKPLIAIEKGSAED
jgi:capsular exopolysaccharide synthesis family protein